MDHIEFVNLVANMRSHQREWFAHHRQIDLTISRKLEKEVDQAVEDFRTGGTLF